jgi:hypothetical protein
MNVVVKDLDGGNDMKRDKAIQNMLGAGLRSDVAEKAFDAGYTLTKLRHGSKALLTQVLGSWYADEIYNTLSRKPIAGEIVEQLVERCDWSCCICWKIDERNPIILHHIEEHAKGGGDTYENLVVLCLNHHAEAHSRWDISQHPVSKELIHTRKREFEEAIALFKRGERAAPGREGDGSDLQSQSDLEVLRQLADFLDRPAVSRPFEIEGNIQDFLVAMSDVIRALNTGVLRTREGDEIGRTRGVRTFSNPHWQEQLAIVRDQFDITRARVETAIRRGELVVREDGFYFFNNRDIPHEIDAMRRAAISILNGILAEAHLAPVRPPELNRYH